MSTSALAAESLCDSYNVQIFATSVLSKANDMKANLIQNDFRGMISTTTSKGKPLYRVRVGPYADQAMAKLIKASLETENIGYPSAKSNVLANAKTPCNQLVTRSDGGEITFKQGSSSIIISGGSVRGDGPNKYELMAGAGQWMEVKVSSIENNAVFQLSVYQHGTGKEVQLKGAKDGEDTKYWYGQLPSPGYSKDGKENAVTINVGSTRGGTSYDMRVAIKDRSWK